MKTAVLFVLLSTSAHALAPRESPNLFEKNEPSSYDVVRFFADCRKNIAHLFPAEVKRAANTDAMCSCVTDAWRVAVKNGAKELTKMQVEICQKIGILYAGVEFKFLESSVPKKE